MKLIEPKKFRIWQYLTTHSALLIRYSGARFPILDDEIMITFRATWSVNLPVFFVADSLEFENISESVADFSFPQKGYGEQYKFLFKNKNMIVGHVEAQFVEIRTTPLSELPPLKSKA